MSSFPKLIAVNASMHSVRICPCAARTGAGGLHIDPRMSCDQSNTSRDPFAHTVRLYYGNIDLRFYGPAISYFTKELYLSHEGFPYPRLFSSRIPVPAHPMLSVFRSWNIIVIETIKEDLKETGAKKKTSGYE